MSRPSPHRRSIRLRGYDYGQTGAYFITICSRNRISLFANIAGDLITLTPIGELVSACWEAIPTHFTTAELDAFVIMPNHLHGIIILGACREEPDGTAPQDAAAKGTACRAPTGVGATSSFNQCAARGERFGAPVAGSIPTIVRSFKSAVTKAVNDDVGKSATCRAFLTDRFGPLPPGRISSLWQSNYHEHVVRDEPGLDHLRAYIAANPARWIADSLHPDNPDAPKPVQNRSRRP